MQIPILEALKTYGTQFNTKDFLVLPNDTPFGNFNLTYDEIVVRIECLNESIINTYQDFYNHQELVRLRGGMSLLNESFKQSYNIEQVIYWLRKTADEFISIIYVLYYFKENNEYPSKIKISSIGRLLNYDKILDDKLTNHFNLLEKINEISNGFKHSIVNTQVHNHRGKSEPVVFALTAFNDISSQPKFYVVSLRAIIESYNKFLIDVKDILQSKYQT